MRNVFVTGSEGFIGSHLTETLVENGYNVTALVLYNSFNSNGWLDKIDSKIKKEINIISGDVRDYDSIKLASKKNNYIIHLASLIAIPYSYTSPESYIETNVKGTLNVLKLAREINVDRFIHTSTSEVYGTAQFVPMTEKHPTVGQSPYSASKIAADQLAISFYRSFGVPVTLLRPFNTFGPRQSARVVIPTMISQILNNKKIINLGSTYPTRDFTYVKDTANSYVECLKSFKTIGETINVASNFEISIKETFDLLCKIMNSDSKIKKNKNRTRPPKSEVDRLYASNTKAKKLMKWKPKYSGKKGFVIGLKKTVEWFSNNENLKYYKHKNYNI